MNMNNKDMLKFLLYMYLCSYFFMIALAIIEKETDPLLAAMNQLQNDVFSLALILNSKIKS